MQDVALPPKRKFNWLVAVVVVAIVGAVAFFLFPRSAEKPKITTQRADKGDVVVKVTATGTLSALVTVQVGSQVSGRITEIDADFNSQVKKGQVIARLDPQLLDQAVVEAKANLVAGTAAVERAKVQAENSVVQRDRARELDRNHLIAKADLDTAELAAKVAQADLGTAQANLEQAKSALERAQVNLSYATIYSPIDGVVISRAVDVGQTVAASLQAPTLFTIAQDLKQMQVDTNVGEADIGKITDGMDAVFTVDAYPGQRFKGKVRQIRNAPQTVQNVVTYDVIIDVDNSDLRLRPGMTANVSFTVATKEGALRVPNAALRFKAPKSFLGGDKNAKDAKSANAEPAASTSAQGDAEKKRAWKRDGANGANGGDGGAEKPKHDDNAPATREVWVMRGEGKEQKAVRVEIKTGLSDGTVTEVVEGDVHEGDELVTEASDPSSSDKGGPPGGMPRRMF